MLKAEKERIVAELTERLRSSDSLIVADYRGLTMTQIDDLRSKLLEHGARFSVVKNTLTRRAAEAAGADSLLALLDGPTAIAFLESGGDPVAVAKALSDSARTTKVLTVRGGILDGKTISEAEVATLATLPPVDTLRAQMVGVLAAPLATVVGLFTAPLRDLVGVLDARIHQLEEEGGVEAQPEPPVRDSGPAEGASGEPGGAPATAETEAAPEEPVGEEPESGLSAPNTPEEPEEPTEATETEETTEGEQE
jgi:large subunit ribosomal protein L10